MYVPAGHCGADSLRAHGIFSRHVSLGWEWPLTTFLPPFFQLFALLKVLQLPKDDPLCWQVSLVDTEVQYILEKLWQKSTTPPRHSRATPAPSKAGAQEVACRSLSEDELWYVGDFKLCQSCVDVLHVRQPHLPGRDDQGRHTHLLQDRLRQAHSRVSAHITNQLRP